MHLSADLGALPGLTPTEPIPQNSGLMVTMLVAAHPRNLSPHQAEQEAMAAIVRESKKSGGQMQAHEYLLEQTKVFAKITVRYPDEDTQTVRPD